MQPDAPTLREALVGASIEGTGGIRYHVRNLLGEGGQGWVYRANYDDPDGFWVVVKVLRPEALETEALRRFEREAEVLRMLGSVPTPNPNIVRFFDYGVHAIPHPHGEVALPFLVLELVEGPTLARVIQAQGGFGMPTARVRRIMKQVARALLTVHAQSIVHRDLKPSNILLASSQGQEIAKVTDFGLVKLPQLSSHRTATVAGASMGYAPPEQYEMGNNRVSVQTDVFSFGAILFESLSGAEAFPCRPGDNPLRVVARMLSGERPQLTRVAATLPRELRDRPHLVSALDAEIARATSADPAHRHRSIRELWERIEPLLGEAAGRVGGMFEEQTTGFHGASLLPQAPAPPTSIGSNPEWRLAGRPLTGERLRHAVVSQDGRALIALGAQGLYHFARGVWSALALPQGVEARQLRGLLRLASGEVLLFGEHAFALTLRSSGVADRIPIPDDDVTLLGACLDPAGVSMVGERVTRSEGVLVEIHGSGSRVRAIPGTRRLTSVACVADGSVRLACGSHGALVDLSDVAPRDVQWSRTGHLHSVAASPDGALYAVGSGGHALRIARSPGATDRALPIATLEAVQTTRDLHFVVVDAFGVAWALGGQARLMQRRSGVWTRLPLDVNAVGALIALGVRDDGVTLLVEDGTVLEGRPRS